MNSVQDAKGSASKSHAASEFKKILSHPLRLLKPSKKAYVKDMEVSSPIDGFYSDSFWSFCVVGIPFFKAGTFG
jgi:hypothetical protein